MVIAYLYIVVDVIDKSRDKWDIKTSLKNVRYLHLILATQNILLKEKW